MDRMLPAWIEAECDYLPITTMKVSGRIPA